MKNFGNKDLSDCSSMGWKEFLEVMSDATGPSSGSGSGSGSDREHGEANNNQLLKMNQTRPQTPPMAQVNYVPATLFPFGPSSQVSQAQMILNNVNPASSSGLSFMQIMTAGSEPSGGNVQVLGAAQNNMNPTKHAGRKRVTEGWSEEAIRAREEERRIKNRISAAQSRARKNDHIRELTEQVERLTRDNARLRREQAILQAARLTEAQMNYQKAENKARMMKRTFSSPSRLG